MQKNTTDNAVTDETRRLLPRAFQNGTVSSARWALSKKWPPGNSGGTPCAATCAVWEPSRKDQYSGAADPSANASSRP